MNSIDKKNSINEKEKLSDVDIAFINSSAADILADLGDMSREEYEYYESLWEQYRELVKSFEIK